MDFIPVKYNSNSVLKSYLMGLSENSRYTMFKSLKRIVKIVNPDINIYHFPWEKIQPIHINTIRFALSKEKISPKTANLSVFALKGIVKECWRLNLIDNETYLKINQIKSFFEKKVETGNIISKNEFNKLILNCESDEKVNLGIRDSAILSLLIISGIRRQELLNIKYHDILQNKILINGKGNKQRFIYLNDFTNKRLNSWISLSKINVGNLFKLSGYHISRIIKKRCIESNIKIFKPHDFRRTFITKLLEDNIDINTVSQMAGHSNINTTAKYDKRNESRKVDIINNLNWED